MNVTDALDEEGEIGKYAYILHGNPVNSSTVVICEKFAILHKAAASFGFDESTLFMFVPGIPSAACLAQLKKLKAKRFIYFGDMDPISFYKFFALRQLTRKPQPDGKTKLHVEYGGITLADYDYYMPPNAQMRLNDREKTVLEFVSHFRMPDVKAELAFIRDSSLKLEIDAFSRYGFDNYLKDKLKQNL